ncbi:MAG: helix-turn-helix domain-containing protein [Phycisphaerae bacterium]|nr:helix-turn-helix domain-containing protein [Phycisphaerae bacterium]
MENVTSQSIDRQTWTTRPEVFPELMTPVEAAMFLRLDQVGHTPEAAIRTLNYWRDKGYLKATKYARRIWYLKSQLEEFLKAKTEI